MQLAGLSELALWFSVEKNFGVVLTGNDQERPQFVTGQWFLDRLPVLNYGRRLIITRDLSGGILGRKPHSRRRWFRSCLGRSGDDRGCDGRRHGGNCCGGLRYWWSGMFSREEKDRCNQGNRGAGGENQPCGVRSRRLFQHREMTMAAGAEDPPGGTVAACGEAGCGSGGVVKTLPGAPLLGGTSAGGTVAVGTLPGGSGFGGTALAFARGASEVLGRGT